MKQSVVVLDLEGVLTPEIWISVAEKTRIPELRRTTRDEPDYDKLMRGRIKILDQHGLKLADIQEVIATLSEREQKVLKLRFGIADGCPRTLEEVGSMFTVTRERIRQIEAKALRKLRHPTRLQKLEGFLETRN